MMYAVFIRNVSPSTRTYVITLVCYVTILNVLTIWFFFLIMIWRLVNCVYSQLCNIFFKKKCSPKQHVIVWMSGLLLMQSSPLGKTECWMCKSKFMFDSKMSGFWALHGLMLIFEHETSAVLMLGRNVTQGSLPFPACFITLLVSFVIISCLVDYLKHWWSEFIYCSTHLCSIGIFTWTVLFYSLAADTFLFFDDTILWALKFMLMYFLPSCLIPGCFCKRVAVFCL